MTIQDLLRDADPLRQPDPVDPAIRDMQRRRVVAAASVSVTEPHVPSRRAFVLSGAVALTVAGLLMAPAWWPGAPPLHAAVPFEVRVAEAAAGPGLSAAVDAAAGRTIYLDTQVVLANGDISSARAVPVGEGFGVEVAFTKDGAAKIRAATATNVGRLLAVVVDGKVIASPRITSAVDQIGIMGGRYTSEEAQRIAVGVLGR